MVNLPTLPADVHQRWLACVDAHQRGQRLLDGLGSSRKEDEPARRRSREVTSATSERVKPKSVFSLFRCRGLDEIPANCVQSSCLGKLNIVLGPYPLRQVLFGSLLNHLCIAVVLQMIGA